jgi:hypothetical protein
LILELGPQQKIEEHLYFSNFIKHLSSKNSLKSKKLAEKLKTILAIEITDNQMHQFWYLDRFANTPAEVFHSVLLGFVNIYLWNTS